jgi:hypothetical protein
MLAAANFLAAFGGGALIRYEDGFRVKDGTLLDAFVIGSTIGIGLLYFLPARLTRRCASIGGGLISLVMALLIIPMHLHEQGVNADDLHAKAIFGLMAIRFSLWFVARVLRPDAVASAESSIGWVELLYYVGMIVGLALGFFFAPISSIQLLLFIDSGLQFTAGALDLISSWSPAGDDDAGGGRPPVRYALNLAWYVRATTAVAALTVGVQAVTFLFAGIMTPPESSAQGNAAAAMRPVVLAVFYFGVAVGSIVFALTKIKLKWPQAARGMARLGSVKMGGGRGAKRAPFLLVSLACAVLLCLAVVGNLLQVQSREVMSRNKAGFFLLSIAAAALIYELLALAIFNHIGKRMRSREGMVALAYGFMACGVAGTLVLFHWLLGEGGSAEEKHYIFLAVMAASLVVANLAMSWPAQPRRRTLD